jgi:hypothetical protein
MSTHALATQYKAEKIPIMSYTWTNPWYKCPVGPFGTNVLWGECSVPNKFEIEKGLLGIDLFFSLHTHTILISKLAAEARSKQQNLILTNCGCVQYPHCGPRQK